MQQIWLYHYYFHELDKPVIIQAINKKEARHILVQNIPTGKTTDDIVQETVSQAVTGISYRYIDGKKYLWAGVGKGDGGWVAEDSYESSEP